MLTDLPREPEEEKEGKKERRAETGNGGLRNKSSRFKV
jgi:hypothetical protein